MAEPTTRLPPAEPYSAPPDEARKVGDIQEKFRRYRMDRLHHEPQWFVNSAFERGQQWVRWSPFDNKLQQPGIIPGRERLVVNKVFHKMRARRAKFLKNRPTWVVVAATTNTDDKLNARATGKVLDYLWRKLHLEQRYRDTLSWTMTCGRGYWWLHWDESQWARVQLDDPTMGKTIEDAQLGDVMVEAGSPFEVLIGDPGMPTIAQQPNIIRCKMRPIEDIRARYPQKGKYVAAEATTQEVFRFERQIAQLSALGISSAQIGKDTTKDGEPTHVLVLEYFERPGARYPKGYYCVIAGNILVKEVEELPYGFSDMENPYPVVEFPDVANAGQYWATTVCEQLVHLQREYNTVRSKISSQLKSMAHPKILVPKQAKLAPGAWHSEEGEIVEWVWLPGMPPPTPWHPPNIAQDAWRSLELLGKEFDDVSQIYPASEGTVGDATSGFQTNLLQEATDAVHGPDIRAHELAIEEAAFKIRRIVKQMYQVPRLITVTGRNYQPEVFEFSAQEVDEHADIVVEAGSALPALKGAKIQAVLELFAKGLLGDPADPDVRRRALSMLEMGQLEEAQENARRDSEQAQVENLELTEEGKGIPDPQFYENHLVHYQEHTNLLKSPASDGWPVGVRQQLIMHTIKHMAFINPQGAQALMAQYGGGPPPAMPQAGPPQPQGPQGPQMARPAPPQAPAQPPQPMPPPGPTSGAGVQGRPPGQFNPEFGFGAESI